MRTSPTSRRRIALAAIATGLLVGVIWLGSQVWAVVTDLAEKASIDPDAEFAALAEELESFDPEALDWPDSEPRPIDAPSLVPPSWRGGNPPAPARSSRHTESSRPRDRAPSPPARVDPIGSSAAEELIRRRLTIPVEGVTPEDLLDTFSDPRSGGRTHRAIDIMAPRGTPVVAVESGRVARIFSSRLGGNALYLVDEENAYVYYYAHLDAYARGLEEGQSVERGDRLGTVGSTGNAPDSAPHLHLAIYSRRPGSRMSRGEPINPYPILVAGMAAE